MNQPEAGTRPEVSQLRQRPLRVHVDHARRPAAPHDGEHERHGAHARPAHVRVHARPKRQKGRKQDSDQL